MIKLLTKEIPLYILLILTTGFIFMLIYKNSVYQNEKQSLINLINDSPTQDNNLIQVRLHNYKYIQPLLYTKIPSESREMRSLKSDLETEVNILKTDGYVENATVYIKLLNKSDWIYANNSSGYKPGSILKIAAAITFLKMTEANPKLLDKEFIYSGSSQVPLQQTYNEKPMIAGKKYTAHEILYEMLVKSNNEAANMINMSLDVNLFKQLFTELEIPEPDVHDLNYTMDIRDLSKFMRILYNASYLNNDNSEYCLTLLSQSSFNKGVMSELPANIKIAHKFGEAGDRNEEQLHETAIIYNGDNPYIITVMTRGKDVYKLAQAIGKLSKLVYDRLKSF